MNRQTVILALFIAGIVCSSALGKYGGGSGEPNNPYLIYDANQMNAIGADQNDWDKQFKLMEDIDLGGYTGTNFNIIGTDWDHPFTGIVDGNGHTISNFKYNSNNINYIGLFGYVKSGGIKNLGLIDPNIHAGMGRYVGALVGRVYSGVNITDCYSYGGCVAGDSDTGGLVGQNRGTITNCYSSTSVEGNVLVGGLVGYHLNYTIINCYSTGNVTGGSSVGGLIGKNWGGTISKSYAFGSVSGAYDVGGLVGWNLGPITSSCSTGSVDGDENVGGLIGYHYNRAINDCYATGSVAGNLKVGGLVGINGFCQGTPFCTWVTGPIVNSYSSGSVEGNGSVGGLIGFGSSGILSVMDSFWDIEMSGQTHSIGGRGLPTDQMQTASTFTDAGWDFVNVWNIGENQTYPYLRVYLPSDINKDGIVNFLDIAITANQWMEEK
jgi:hypothetical protein